VPRRFSALCLLVVCLSGCGFGTPRATSADLAPVLQPTPDPTLDAVVRDLPRALAGVPPTPTPTPRPAIVAPKPSPKPVVRATPTPVGNRRR
jgi:hypothetical protein